MTAVRRVLSVASTFTIFDRLDNTLPGWTLKSSTAFHKVSAVGGGVRGCWDPPLGNKLQQWQLLEPPLQPAQN